MADIIEIGNYQFKHKSRFYKTKECNHHHLVLCDDGYHVLCEDCNTSLSAYWVLQRMLNQYRKAVELLELKKEQFNKIKEKDLSLIIAKELEKLLRSKSYAPTCPHCNHVITTKDKFGSKWKGRVSEAIIYK